jgi:hypothetical protein
LERVHTSLPYKIVGVVPVLLGYTYPNQSLPVSSVYPKLDMTERKEKLSYVVPIKDMLMSSPHVVK